MVLEREMCLAGQARRPHLRMRAGHARSRCCMNEHAGGTTHREV